MPSTGPKTNAFSRGGRTLRKRKTTLKRSKGKQGRRYNLRAVGTRRAIRKR